MAKTTLLLAAFVATINAIAAPAPEITPAPLIRRQIESRPDPPYDVLGSPDQYIITDLGPDTSIISYDGSSYHYIEGHTKYFSEETTTTTVESRPTISVITVGVVASTVAIAVGDLNAGDTSLTFSEKVAESLTSSAKEAAAACGLSAKSKKEKRLDSLQCIVDNAVKLSGEGGPLEAAATEEFWTSLAIDLAENAPELFANAIAVIKSQAQKKKALVMIAAIIGVKAVKETLAALSIPAKGVGSKTETEEDNDQKCDPSKEADENSPLCQDCKGDEEKARCTEGDDKGCPCLPVGDIHTEEFDKAWADEQQGILSRVIAGIDNPDKDLPEAECDKDQSQYFSATVFNGGVYKQFCEDISKNPKSAFHQTVDIDGNYIRPKNAKRSLRSRAESADTNAYKDARIALDWTGGDGFCQSDCAKVYSAMSESSCWHTAGDSNTLGIMATEAKLDTGCGTYWYKIDLPSTPEPPPPPPGDDPPPEEEEITVGSRNCIPDPRNIGCWKDVHKGKVDETADEFEKHFNTQNEVMKSDTKNITQVLREGGQSGSGVTYMMNIGWIPGCKIVEEQDARNPVPDDQSVGWKDLLKDNYYKCTDNQGLGGWTDVGCLRYGFYPNNAGVFDSPPHPEKFFDKMSYCG